MTLHMPQSPMSSIAREAMDMSDKHGDKAFRTMAMVSMGVMAFAGASQVFLELIKALNRNDRSKRGHDDHVPERSWQEREHDRRASRSLERG